MTRHLPLFTERTLAETKADQVSLGQAFRQAAGQVSCRPGCDNCCSHAVHATLPEGVLVYRALVLKGLWTPSLRKRLMEHAAQTWDLAPEVWHLSNLPCPLLEKSRCLIYAARPFVCRTVLSRGAPEECHPHKASLGNAILPRQEMLGLFFGRQHRLLQRHHTNPILLALSKAVLCGEKIATGERTLEDSLAALIEERDV